MTLLDFLQLNQEEKEMDGQIGVAEGQGERLPHFGAPHQVQLETATPLLRDEEP